VSDTTPSRAKRFGRGLLGIFGILIAVALVAGALVLPGIVTNLQNQSTTASSRSHSTSEHIKEPDPAGGADCSVPKFMSEGPHVLGAIDQEDCQYAQSLDENGNYTVIPSYDGGVLTGADTSNNPQTPPTFDNDGVCNTPLNWYQWFNCGSEADIAQRKADLKSKEAQTGITLAEAEKWADDWQLRNKVTLNIQVYGGNWTDEEARLIASGLVGEDIANQLEIVRHPDGVLINTTRRADGTLGEFRDWTDMVRVSLAPIYYASTAELSDQVDKAGHTQKYMLKEVPFLVKGADSGVFVDCFNIWWIEVRIWDCKASSCKPPHENPVCRWNPNLPPDHPDCFKPKSTSSSGYLYLDGKGKNGRGGGGESEADEVETGDDDPGDEVEGEGEDGSDEVDLGGDDPNDDDPGEF
jgi:hypothetical protein